jgi:hypothetical protein
MRLKVTDREIAIELRKSMPCNCDLDNWVPEQRTGHTHVCRVHRSVLAVRRGDKAMPIRTGGRVDG